MISRYKQSRNEPHEGQHPFAESMPPPDAPRRPKTEKHAQAARKGGKHDERGRKDASAFKNDISKRELSQAPENAAAVSSSTDARGGGKFEIQIHVHIHAHHVRNTRSKRPECRRRHTPRNSAAAEIRKQ